MTPLHLILFKGHPGTGKSTLAQALARRLRWPLIDKDDVKDFTMNLPDGNILAYDIAWRVVETQLSLGISTVVDTPLSYPVGYEIGKELAHRWQAHLWVIETKIDEAIWRARLQARRAEAHTHKISSWESMQTLLGVYNGCWHYPIDPVHHLLVDTTRDLTTLVNELCETIVHADDSKQP